VDIKGELELFQHQILGVSGGSPGQQLKLMQFLTRKIAEQKAQLVLEEGRMEKSSEVLVKGFTENDAHLFLRLEAWMREVKDQVREEIRAQIGL
jgi:threonyl-tRNA synthetase